MLIKYVKATGGDYSDITTAFTDMLLSGVLASGQIMEYGMYIDSGTYSGTLSGYIPYSGKFNIIGSGTIVYLDPINQISGEYLSALDANLYFQNLVLDTSGHAEYSFTIYSGLGISFSDIQFLNNISGINNLGGSLFLNNSHACGISGTSTTFINNRNSGICIIENSDISCYGTGIYSSNTFISNSKLFNNNTAIKYTSGFNLSIDKSLFYRNIIDVSVQSGNFYSEENTFTSPVNLQDTYIYSDRCIYYSVSGVAQSGSYITNSDIYPISTIDSNISGNNNISEDPLFNSVSVADYNLKLEQTNGSPCIELKLNNTYDESVECELNNTSINIYDNQGKLNLYEFINYIYIQDSVIVLSDYNKEIKFADKINNYKNLNYDIYFNAKFDAYNTKTKSSFNLNINSSDDYPWDWDLVDIKTTQIKENKYIIPRSIIDIEDVVLNYIKVLPNDIFFENIYKNNIKVYNKIIYNGVAYDSSLSVPSENIIWVIDANNQNLIKQNVYTSEVIEKYPLLCPSYTKSLIRPSGLIYIGVNDNYYRFIRSDDPNIELKGKTENGDFLWIPTNINNNYDIRGILSYKDNLFLTASLYATQTTNREIVYSGQANGKLLMYNNNDLFENMILKPDQLNGPISCDLLSGNYYPTDITMYEDGNLLIADYNSGIFKYKLAYDYALLSTSYDDESKILLREYYNDVSL